MLALRLIHPRWPHLAGQSIALQKGYAMLNGVVAGADPSRRHMLLGCAGAAGALLAQPRRSWAAGPGGTPAALRLAGRTCALVFIDMQLSNARDSFKPNSFSSVLSNGTLVAGAVRRAGGLVARTHVLEAQVLHPSVDDPLPFSPPAPDAADFAPGAEPSPGDAVITKRQWGAFYGADLDQQLRRKAIETLLIAGVATELGVESTARAAYDRGYGLVFVEDALSGATSKGHEFFIKELFPRMGHVRSSSQVAAALSAG